MHGGLEFVRQQRHASSLTMTFSQCTLSPALSTHPLPAARQSSKSSSLKADELLELLKTDVSLNDVPQSGEVDEQVRLHVWGVLCCSA